MKKITKLSTLLFCLITPLTIFSQTPGATIIRIEDGVSSRCVNRNEDAIQIGLVGMKISKKKNWFKEQTQAGVQVGVRIEGMDAEYNTKATEFTQVYVVDVKEYDKGSILLPIEGNIVRYFPLQNKGVFFNGIDLSISLMQRKDDAPFGIVVKELVNFTKQFPLPTNPFDPAIKTLANFTSNLLSPANDEGNKINRPAPVSTINLPFSPIANCSENSFQEKTGVFAVIYGSNEVTEEGYVDINKTTDYAYKLQTSPSRAILVAKKDKQGKLSSFKPLHNEFIMFYLNSFSTNPTSPKTVLTMTPNTDTKINSKDAETLLEDTEWYKTASSEFKDKYKMILSDIENKDKFGTYEFIKGNKVANAELFKSDAAIIDYVEATRRLINLGLEEQIKELPELPVFLQKK